MSVEAFVDRVIYELPHLHVYIDYEKEIVTFKDKTHLLDVPFKKVTDQTMNVVRWAVTKLKETK